MILDATGVAAALRACLRVVRAHEAELNRLNVFPVPDHDTGTNLAGTLDAIVRKIDAAGEGTGLDALAMAVVDGGLAGARGNGGVILAEGLRGLTASWAGLDRVDAAALALGFRAAAEHAYCAVLRPAEGSIVSVMRATGEALRVPIPADPAGLLDLAAHAAHRAVAATRWQLDVLRAAGLVDAGGHGWALCVGAFAAVANGRRTWAALPDGPAARADRTMPIAHDADSWFEVQYVLACTEEALPMLREQLAEIGDSVAIAGKGGRYRVHVHTGKAEAAVRAAARLGRISHLEVLPL